MEDDDAAVRRFAGLTHAPTAPWSGDRPLEFRQVALPRRRMP
jgi:hypothetical protein